MADGRPPVFPPTWADKKAAPGRRLFLGFPPRRLEPLLRAAVDGVLGPPRTERLEDVIFQPLVKMGRGQLTGGVFQRGRFVDRLALMHGTGASARSSNGPSPERPLADPPPRAIDRAWFGGYLFDAYGHFLLEGLAHLLGTEARVSLAPILCFNPHRLSALADYMVATFARFGLDPRRIRLCDEETHVRELLVQEPSFVIRNSVRPSVYADLPKVVGAARGWLYVSRRGVRSPRAIAGEEAIEQMIAARHGAVILRPETLSLDAQLAALAAADTLVGCEGSAFHSLLFLQKAPRTIMLCGGPPNLNYLLADELVAGDIAYVNAALPPAHRKDWTIELDATRDGIAEAVRLLG